MATTQTARRAKYGLNVAVALLAAAGIVIGINALTDWVYRKADPTVKGWLRLDVTATRQYSLSPQTRKVLSELDGEYRIVALFQPDSIETQRVLDLLEEYPRYSGHVMLEQLDPFRDVVGNERFLQAVFERYSEELGPVQDATEAGAAAIEQTVPAFADLTAGLQSAVEVEADQAAAWTQRLQLGVLKQIEQELPRVLERVEQAKEQPLPDYDGTLRMLQSALAQLGERYPQIIGQYRSLVQSAQTPPAIKEAILQAIRQFEALQAPAQQALDQLEGASPPTRYTEVMLTLAQQQSVAVLGPNAVRVVPVSEMYQAVEGAERAAGEEPTVGFLGEEKITGALVSLTLDQQPLAVFVYSGPQPVIGPRGTYQFVAQRLESANFKVMQWNPAGEMTPFGQPMPPGPAPEPEAGQPAVWIITPPPAPDPRNPTSMAGGDREPIAQLIRERLAAGDGVLTMFSPNPAAQFGSPDAVLDVVKAWGLDPQLNRVAVQETVAQGRERVPTWQFLVTRWPGDLPITAALSGMRGVFVGPSPVTVTDDAPEDVQTRPLVMIEQPRLWVTEKFGNIRSLDELTFEPDNARDAVTVGVAAERGDARLIVMAAGYWAIDQITMTGQGGLPAELTGLAFPANSELLVNSALWLADLDQLIAASPRTQDIRRVGDVSPATMTLYRWLLMAVVPLAILATGLGVYLVRRRD